MRKLITISLLAIITFVTGFAQEVVNVTTPPDSTLIETDSLDEDDYFQMEQLERMDNMLDLWYVKRELANSNSILSKLTDDTSQVEHNDSLIISRLSKMAAIFPIRYNERVKRYVELYSMKRKRSCAAMLGLAQYYYPWMKEIFDKYNLPEELVYLTIVESGLNPNAVSRMGATGIWQFMYTTGKMYGLDVNTFIDDRRDPVKATDAAARHLRDLYDTFNDWGLAISAYNCGAGNVRKAIQRSGGKKDFWAVSKYLPKETQNYYPAFLGAYYMMEYHYSYNIFAGEISIPSGVDTVMVDKELHLEQIANVLNINIDEIKTLNPQYKRLVVPAYIHPYPICLRSNDVIRFLDMKDSIYKYQHDLYFTPLKVYENSFTGVTTPASEQKKIYHTVKSGETLSSIAIKHGLSVYELKKMNRLSSNYIKVKQRLVVGYQYIPPKEETPNPGATQPADSIKAVVPTDSLNAPQLPVIEEEPPVIVYYVKKGDNLSAIASRYRTTIRKIAEFNKLTNINNLKVGQKLLIPRNSQ